MEKKKKIQKTKEKIVTCNVRRLSRVSDAGSRGGTFVAHADINTSQPLHITRSVFKVCFTAQVFSLYTLVHTGLVKLTTPIGLSSREENTHFTRV